MAAQLSRSETVRFAVLVARPRQSDDAEGPAAATSWPRAALRRAARAAVRATCPCRIGFATSRARGAPPRHRAQGRGAQAADGPAPDHGRRRLAPTRAIRRDAARLRSRRARSQRPRGPTLPAERSARAALARRERRRLRRKSKRNAGSTAKRWARRCTTSGSPRSKRCSGRQRP